MDSSARTDRWSERPASKPVHQGGGVSVSRFPPDEVA
jgi:hypothetical protein